jgi:hypothetical protein
MGLKAKQAAEKRRADMLRICGDPALEKKLEKQRGLYQHRAKGMSPMAQRLMAQSIFSRAKALGQEPGVKLPMASDWATGLGGHRTETKEVR